MRVAEPPHVHPVPVADTTDMPAGAGKLTPPEPRMSEGPLLVATIVYVESVPPVTVVGAPTLRARSAETATEAVAVAELFVLSGSDTADPPVTVKPTEPVALDATESTTVTAEVEAPTASDGVEEHDNVPALTVHVQ